MESEILTEEDCLKELAWAEYYGKWKSAKNDCDKASCNYWSLVRTCFLELGGLTKEQLKDNGMHRF